MSTLAKKRRILHLTHNDIRTDARTLKQIHAAEQHGYEVFGLGVQLNKGLQASRIDIQAQIKSFRLFSHGLRIPKVLMHTCVMIELFIRMLFNGPKFKPDIIHCSDTLVLPAGALLKMICRAKLVYDAHELESQKNGSTRITSAATLLIEKVLWPMVDALVIVSTSIENWYAKHLGPKFSRVVLNSPLLGKVGGKTDYLREKFRIPAGHKIFIYIGIFTRGRGIEQMLEVFSNNRPEASIIFLGYGELEPVIEEAAKANNNIFLHHGVEHENVVPITRSADVGICLLEQVSLSDYYALPNKFFEYIFAGVPVIASNFPDLQRCVEEYQVGVCTDISTEGLAKAVDAFISNEEKIGIDISTLAPLSWSTQGEKLMEAYQFTMRGNNGEDTGKQIDRSRQTP